MKDKIAYLDENATWVLFDKPPESDVIGCRWIYKINRHVDGSIKHCNDRLVAQGYNQHEGMDYTYSYCPVVKPATVRCVLALAASRRWHLQ